MTVFCVICRNCKFFIRLKKNLLIFIFVLIGIGQHMAEIEARLILIYFVKNFKVETIFDPNRVLYSSITYAPINDQLIKIHLK
jgi:hypothetical protein